MTDKPMTVEDIKEDNQMTEGELMERYKIVSVESTKDINKRRHEGETDSLESSRRMADIILNNRANISMVEIINYSTGHVEERHIIPRQKIPVT